MEDKLRIALGIATGLGYLHQAQPSKPSVIHNDIRGANIKFDSSLVPKISNFSAAQIYTEDKQLLKQFEGSLGYTAPEIMEQKPYTPMADIFSFGMLLWELFYESVPYQQFSKSDIQHAILSGKRPELESKFHYTSKHIQKLISECWQTSPNKRPSLSDIKQTLNKAVSKVQAGSMNSITNWGQCTLEAILQKDTSGFDVFSCTVGKMACIVKMIPIGNIAKEEITDICCKISKVEQLSQEADRHHIIRYLHHAVDKSYLRIFMEYMPATLDSFINTHQGPLEPVLIRNITSKIAMGLMYLHTQTPPLIHGNLQARNIYISVTDGRLTKLRIADLHLSQSLESAPPSRIFRSAGVYAPEINADANTPRTTASDVYSFGALLSNMLMKYKGNSWVFPSQFIEPDKLASTINAKGNQSQSLALLAASCLDKNPSQRPTVQVICKSLEDILL